MKNFCIVVIFFIWIIIKNYLCDIKSEKKWECFDVDGGRKFKNWKKKKMWTVTILCCSDP
jgi:hypothetical protein